MSTFETARHASVGVLTFIRNLVTHPLQMIQRGFVASKTYTTGTPTLQTMNASYETPYMWSREFVEQSGYNLTERIPAILGVYEVPGQSYAQRFTIKQVVTAVPPQLIHDLSLHWIFTFVEGVVCFFMSLDKFDVAWLLFEVSVCLLVYLCRRRLLPIISSVWDELKQDVDDFCQRQFPPAPIELPPGTTIISAADIQDMNTSLNAIQQRINHLRISKFNFVRSRPGIVINLPIINKLQTQIGKVQKALEAEKASHQKTWDFVEQQSNGRADLEAELELLKARLETGGSELEGHSQLETIIESTAEAAQVERLEALREKLESDNAHHERRIEALETQLRIEETSREEAEKAARDLRERCEWLEKELLVDASELENPDYIYPGPDPNEEDEEAKKKEFNERREKYLEEMTKGHRNNDDNGTGDDDERPNVASMATADADLAQADHSTKLPEPAEHTPPAETPLDEGRPANAPTPEPSSQRNSLKGSVSAFVPSALPGRSIILNLPEHTPAPRVTGPEGRRKSGMPDSVEDEEGVAGPDDVLDDMHDRQVAQFQKFAPTPDARGSMWGALNDVPSPLENTSAPSSPPSSIQQPQEGAPPAQIADLQPSTTPPSESNTNPNAEHEIRHASGEDSGQKASTQADKPMKSPRDKETQEISGHNSSENIGADEGDGWSDFDDEQYEEGGDDSAPMLGKYKVTRGPQNDQGDDDLPVSGSHPAPNMGTSDIIVLDKGKVTRKEGNKEGHKKTPEAKEEPKNDPKSLLPHLAHLATKGGLPQERQTARRRPSNYFPGIENATKTHAEEVGEAFTDYVSKHAKGTLADSMWAPKPNGKAKEIPQKAPSRPVEGTVLPVAQNKVDSGPDPKAAQDEPPRSATRRPSNYFPGMENAVKTQDEEVGDVFAEFARERGILKLSDSIWAPKPDEKAPKPDVTAPKPEAKARLLPHQKIPTAAEGVTSPHKSSQSDEAPKPDPKPDTKAQLLPHQRIPTAAEGITSPHTSNQSEDQATTQAPTKRLPSNFFPGMENATKTHSEEVGDALADYLREHATGKLSDSIWAPKPDATQPTPQTAPSTAAKAAASPRPPTQPGVTAPTRAPPRGPPNFNLLPSPNPPPGAPTGPRGHASGAERSNSQVDTSCGLDNPDTTPRVRLPSPPPPQAQQTPPQIPPANRPRAQPQTPAPGSGNRNAGLGARGRGGARGGRGGGLGTPAPRAGPSSGNSTGDSFRRLQENMARAEEERRRQG